MKLLFYLLFLASIVFGLLVSGAFGQAISTRTLNPSEPMQIAISPLVVTTLLFPDPPSGSFGLGIVTEGTTGMGSVQLSHPSGSKVFALHALSDGAAVTMTVLMSGVLYVFVLRVTQAPDIAITLVKEPSTPLAAK
jgi:hypothetical protein